MYPSSYILGPVENESLQDKEKTLTYLTAVLLVDRSVHVVDVVIVSILENNRVVACCGANFDGVRSRVYMQLGEL